MREIAFIKQNKSKWLDFEKQLNNKADRNSDELANSYIQLLNDLAFSQTYYPKSKTTVYLNYLVSQIYIKIYKTRRVEGNKWKSFFLTEVPLLVYRNKTKVIFAFLMFLFFTVLGVIS